MKLIAHVATALILVSVLVMGAVGADLPAGGGEGFYETSWRAASMPHKRITLSSKLEENVESVPVIEGQAVKKGDVLVRFDARLMDARLAVAKEEADFKTRIEKATNTVRYAQRELKRIEPLIVTGVSESDVDKARFQAETAAAELQELERTKRLSERQMDYFKAQAEDYVIHSPIDGAVSRVWIDPAEMASRGQALVEVIDTEEIEVHVPLDERYASLVRCGQQTLVKFSAFSEREFTGAVSSVSPDVDSQSGIFSVTILVKPGTGDVKPGMGCQVRFLPGSPS